MTTYTAATNGGTSAHKDLKGVVMSQSPSPAGGEKPGFGGFFQVYLLAAVILMIYYTIDFQVALAPALPGMASAGQTTPRPKPGKKQSSPADATPSETLTAAPAPVQASAPLEPAPLPEPVPPAPMSEFAATPSAPVSAPVTAPATPASEPVEPLPASDASDATTGLLIIDDSVPVMASEPSDTEAPPVEPAVSAPALPSPTVDAPATPDSLTLPPADEIPLPASGPMTDIGTPDPAPAGSSITTEVGQ